MSNLVNHARREMQILGCTEEDTEHVVRVIQSFADIGMSGGSAGWYIGLVGKLVRFKPLTDLTNDPKEWIVVGDGVWQSARDSEAFSKNGGRTYYLLSEGASDARPYPLHHSKLVD